MEKMFEGVLNEFVVTYEMTRRTRGLTIEVWIRNKRMTHNYVLGDQRSGTNSVADLRRKLMAVNASRKQLPAPSAPPTLFGVPLSVAVPADKLSNRVALLTSVAMQPNSLRAKGTANMTVEIVATPEESTASARINEPVANTVASPEAPKRAEADVASPESIATPSPMLLTSPDSRTLYRSVLLAPAEVIVIEMDRDLTVPKGHVLVIPLHDPQLLLDMPKAQYLAFFRQVEKPPEPAEKPVPEVALRRGVPEPPPPPLAEEVVSIPEAVQNQPSPPQSSPSEITRRPYTIKRVIKESVTDEPVTLEMRSVQGIYPQVARHMTAIAHVQRHINRGRAVSVRELSGFLSERDYKQVSARMPVAWKLGFANRSEPTGGQPLRYSITPSGLTLLSKLHTWPWLRDNLPIPGWAES
jgi:hypothetical protein